VAMTDLFGKRVRDARLARKLRARKLAKQLGISLARLQDIEAGRTVPPPQLVREIANALGLEASELLRAASDHDTSEAYLAENAFAGALARRISEGRVVDDELRRLADAAERLDTSRAKAGPPRTIANTEPPSDST
jgi:transcriptional regulator with XRE-family HTH domain